MTSKELLESISVIVAVDGKLTAEEKQYLYEVAKKFRVSKVELNSIFDKVRAGTGTISSPHSLEDQVELYEHLVAAAAADGEITKDEKAILDEFREKFGIGKDSGQDVGPLSTPDSLAPSAEVFIVPSRPESAKPNKSQSISRSGHWVFGTIILIFGVATVWVTWQWINTPTRGANNAPIPPSLELATNEPPLTREELSKIIDSDLMPLIENAHNENTAAKMRALQTFRDHFTGFREGIPDFTEDLTQWGTRFGIVSTWTQDKWDSWWNENDNANRLGEYVHGKFREHVLSEEELEVAYSDTIIQFTGDLTANRNALLSEIKIVLSSQQLPVQIRVPKEDFAQFVERTQEHFSKYSSELGGKSAASGVLGFVGGNAIGWGATKVTIYAIQAVGPLIVSSTSSSLIATTLTPVVTSVTTYFTTMGVTLGGATTAFTLGGGAGGSTVGPIGTGVGVVAGLVAGGVTDWWLSEQFKEKTTTELNSMLDLMEKNIINGVRNESGESAGLDGIFSEANVEMKRLMRQAVLETLYERAAK